MSASLAPGPELQHTGDPHAPPDTPNGTIGSEQTEAEPLKVKLQIPGTCGLGCQEAEGTVAFKTRELLCICQLGDCLHLLYPDRE